MKKWILPPIIVFALLGSSLPMRAQETQMTGPELAEVKSVLLPFLEALRGGDVKGMKPFLSKALYLEYKVLLEQNSEYGQFLRDFYGGATITVSEVNKIESSGRYKPGTATVRFAFPDGNVSELKISLSKGNKGDEANLWKIGREIDSKKPKGRQK